MLETLAYCSFNCSVLNQLVRYIRQMVHKATLPFSVEMMRSSEILKARSTYLLRFFPFYSILFTDQLSNTGKTFVQQDQDSIYVSPPQLGI